MRSARLLCLLWRDNHAPSLQNVRFPPSEQPFKYSSDSGAQEAVVKFDSEAAANTACLLNNALIDGVNIKVEPFPHHESPRTNPPPEQAPTNDSFSSIFSGIASTGRAWAETVSTKVKELDTQYGVSDTVIAGASTAWTESKKFVTELDDKYHVKDSVNSAVQTTKEHMASAASNLNQKFNKTSTPPNSSGNSPTSGSPRQSPRATPPVL